MSLRKFELYQLRKEEFARHFAEIEEQEPIRLSDYDLVYEYKMSTGNDVIEDLSLLFEKFNISHPSDFRGRSISVSDLVRVDDGAFFYCDSIGWHIIHLAK